MKTNVKIFPSLMVVAAVAIGIKATSMVTDFDLLTRPALAQDQDDKKPEPPKTDKKDPPPLENKKDEKKDEKKADDTDDFFSDDVITAEEEDTLKLLRDRSRELDKRERMLVLKEKMLLALDKDLKAKIDRLEKIKADIDIQLGNFEKAEKEKMDKLVDYYNKMKPKDAAPIFANLIRNDRDKAVLLRVMKDMKNTQVSKILAEMTPDQASKITLELANVAKPVINDNGR